MIVVFGAVGVDIVAIVDSIPHPGETMLSETYAIVPGTKGANQALAAARAGAKVSHVGTCGDDAFGTVALSLMREADIDLSHVAIRPLPTGICLVAVDRQGENTVVAAGAANLSTAAAQLAACSFGTGDILLAQRELQDEENFVGIKSAKSRGATVIFNVAPAGGVPDDVLENVDILVVNEHELATLAKYVKIDEVNLKKASEKLNINFGCSVIVTLGGKGAIAWHQGSFHEVAAAVVAVVDTTAAGDSFTGAFAAALHDGHSFAEAMSRAVTAGSLSCTKAGAQPSIPTKSEIDKFLLFAA